MDDPLDILRRSGAAAYLGEPVTVREHSLQAAHLAELEGADPPVVVAALFHDIGWLLRGGARAHEARGAKALARWFGSEVSEPVRLHVAAKRYLSTLDESYFAALTDASKRTMAHQGGWMEDRELATFRGERHADDAIALRRIDDRAKQPGCRTPDLEHFAPLVDALRLPVNDRHSPAVG